MERHLDSWPVFKTPLMSAAKGGNAGGVRLRQPAFAGRASADLEAETARRERIARISDRLNASPSDTAAALEMARLREEDGEGALAESYYRRAVRHAPEDARAGRPCRVPDTRTTPPGAFPRSLTLYGRLMKETEV